MIKPYFLVRMTSLHVVNQLTTLPMKSRNSTRRRRFECVAMIFPVATSSAPNSVRRAVALVVVALAGQDNPRLDTDFLGDRGVLRPATANRTIRARFKSRVELSAVSDNTPQAPCDLSAEGGLLLLRGSSRS
jgi:hypothetical protein